MARDPRRVAPRLCVIMFLQYAALGVWMPILPSYLRADVSSGGLGFTGFQAGWVIAVAPALGAITAPFVAGQLADRYVSSERYLAVSLLISGLSLWALSLQTSFAAWAVLTLVHAVSFFPTLGLATALAMSHLQNPRSQFPRIRVWGTVGWIAVAWVFPALFLQEQFSLQALPPFLSGPDRVDATARIADALRVSAVISSAGAVWSLFLPHTPPTQNAADRFAFVSALRLLRYRSIVVLVAASLSIAAIDRIYFVQAAPYLEFAGLKTSQVMPAMAIGQLSEILVMALLGWLLIRLGFRFVLALGACCYFLRFAVMGTISLPLEVIVGSQALHGVCFACSFVAAMIYVDRLVGSDARHSAQTGFTLVAMGPGAIAGGLLNGLLERQCSGSGQIDYTWFWYACATIGLAAMLGILWMFRDESKAAQPLEGSAT